MKFRLDIRLPILVLMSLAIILSACSGAQSPFTQRISVAKDGGEPDARSNQPSISGNGRYVAFTSDATNLVDGDTNGFSDVFMRDLDKGTTIRVSVAGDGTQGNKSSYWPYISANGRYISFVSEATNLVINDTNEVADVFVHDNKTGETKMASVASDNTPGNDLSFWTSISSDGRYVAFMSAATNLVPSDMNDSWDIFVHDMKTGETSRVSVTSDGKEANSQSEYPVISEDGRYVAFASDATNLVEGDSNGYRDVFEYDRKTNKISRVSVASDGTQANEGTEMGAIAISADGHYVAFASLATNLVAEDTNQNWDIFVHDRDTGETTRVSVAGDGTQANAGSFGVGISAQGRYVTFGSNANNLTEGDTNNAQDVFVHDRQTGQTRLVSVASDGTEGNLASGFTLVVPGGVDIAYGALISSDGNRVVFMSSASNLVDNDKNWKQDVYIHGQ
jgi:Tol biopolymer transport system component